MTTSADVRDQLIDALRLDLVGPRWDVPGHEKYATETLPTSPSRWYLTGFLVPYEAKLEQRSDDTGDEQIDMLNDRPDHGDDEVPPEQASARKAPFPSSMGLSVLVPKGCEHLMVKVHWGDYLPVEGQANHWKRLPREAAVEVKLETSREPRTLPVPDSAGLSLVVSTRPAMTPATGSPGLPKGTRAVSVFLVNNRTPGPDVGPDVAFAFQVELRVHSDQPFVPRPDPRGLHTDDWDEKVADLQYRDAFEFGVGHNVSALASESPAGTCREIRTAWLPRAEVEKVVPAEIKDVELGMEALAKVTSAQALRSMVGPMVAAYTAWITAQTAHFPAEPGRKEFAAELMASATRTRDRIQQGLAALDDPRVLTAFCLANQAMATAIRQRNTHGFPDRKPANEPPPAWRPFQLAFILMNLAGVAEGEHPDRKVVDLLFFPTGGGKTEAYLGLAAFSMLLRRLRDPSIRSAGLCVLMRYTLRLLTLDQLGRAATLICALELMRQQDVTRLGLWPFEIGLWVGQAATPNRMGEKGKDNEYSARRRTIAFQNDPKRKPSPIPLETCPWCGRHFTQDSFQLVPDAEHPLDLRVYCADRGCEWSPRKQKPGLPILAVDEPIYRRLPAFLIATVDKFANLPWVGETGALFGRVDRHDKDGFYGPSEPGKGKPLGGPLPPMELVIQDELHLISGPLGTMVGLYETAIDALAAKGPATGQGVRPKIVASTATVRRAKRQIQGLFGRTEVDVFPPPGPDRRDSFFALTVAPDVKNARAYVAVAAQGRNLKVVLLRTLLTLLGAGQKQWLEAGGPKNADNPADPYMTALCYFNALRELGGARRIIEDEVGNRVADYGYQRRRVGEGEKDGLFANRKSLTEPTELTSRVPTDQVAETKQRLALRFHDKERVDVALATNMISVGLDIVRLGLMVVMGQPKTAAEYIQATSRVGRDDQRPGLVVTLLNVHRPRDRSHYERFAAWHASFYRAVEATSATPFSPRAVDRGLAGVAVALARLGHLGMTAPRSAGDIGEHRAELEYVAELISRRAEGHDKDMEAEEAEALRKHIKGRVQDLLDLWQHLADKKGELQYQREVGVAPPLLHYPLDPELAKLPREEGKFKAPRSLRDVEASVNLWVTKPDGLGTEEADE